MNVEPETTKRLKELLDERSEWGTRIEQFVAEYGQLKPAQVPSLAVDELKKLWWAASFAETGSFGLSKPNVNQIQGLRTMTALLADRAKSLGDRFCAAREECDKTFKKTQWPVILRTLLILEEGQYGTITTKKWTNVLLEDANKPELDFGDAGSITAALESVKGIIEQWAPSVGATTVGERARIPWHLCQMIQPNGDMIEEDSKSNRERQRVLTTESKAILQLLVNYIRAGRFQPDDPESFLGYGDVHKELGREKRGPHWGNSLDKQGLGNLALWIRQKQLPAITGLVIDQHSYEPGDGYYKAFDRSLNDRAWWIDQIRQAIAFDWSPYVEDDPVPTAEELLSYTKAVIEGTLNTVSMQVRTRCEALRRRAKEFYRDADRKLRCKVCGWNKPDNRISGDIVELHHMKPLSDLTAAGVNLTMREAIDSLVPLCPCCHRIAHSRIGGGSFSIKELTNIIPKYPGAATESSVTKKHGAVDAM